MAALPWALATERAVGKGHGSLSDVVNRPLRQMLIESGHNPDADPFPGLMGPVFNVKAYGAVGNGSADDTGGFQGAFAAAGTKGLIYVPDPDAGQKYRITSKLTPQGNQTIVGQNKRTTKISKEFNGDLMDFLSGIALHNLYLEGNGETRTGRGLVLAGVDGNQLVSDCRIINFDGACVDFTTTTCGGRSVWRNVEAWRTSSDPGTNRFAFVTVDGEQLTAVVKHWENLDTAGLCAIDFGGCDNNFVTCSRLGDLKFTAESRQVSIGQTRIAGSASLSIPGIDIDIVACAVFPQIVLAATSQGCVIGPNSSNQAVPVVDNSNFASNQVTHGLAAYTPTLSSSGTAPSLGDGTLVGEYARHGAAIFFSISLTLGSTTSLGSGELRFSLPVTRRTASVQEPGGWIGDDSGTRYVGVVQSPGAVNYVRLMRDTSGLLSATSPVTWAAGDIIRLSGSYTL